MTLGEKIRMLRREKGWSGEEFAKKMGVTRTAVSNWENNNRKPDIITLPQIAQLLGTTTDHLLGVAATDEAKKRIDRMIDTNDELYETWVELKKRDTMKVLFKQVKDMDDTGLRQVLDIIKIIESRYN